MCVCGYKITYSQRVKVQNVKVIVDVIVIFKFLSLSTLIGF